MDIERLTLAHQPKLTHHEFLELLLADEVTRRDTQSAILRAKIAGLDPEMLLDRWDDTAKITHDRTIWNELCSLRFVDAPNDVVILGPVGVGKTFLAERARPHRNPNHHPHADADNPDLVPSLWRTSGPITLAGDIEENPVCVGVRRNGSRQSLERIWSDSRSCLLRYPHPMPTPPRKGRRGTGPTSTPTSPPSRTHRTVGSERVRAAPVALGRVGPWSR